MLIAAIAPRVLDYLSQAFEPRVIASKEDIDGLRPGTAVRTGPGVLCEVKIDDKGKRYLHPMHGEALIDGGLPAVSLAPRTKFDETRARLALRAAVERGDLNPDAAEPLFQSIRTALV